MTFQVIEIYEVTSSPPWRGAGDPAWINTLKEENKTRQNETNKQ